MDNRLKRIKAAVERLDAACHRKISDRLAVYKLCGEYPEGLQIPKDAKYESFDCKSVWGTEKLTHTWFKVILPLSRYSEKDEFEFVCHVNLFEIDIANPQFLIFVDGEKRQGFDVNHRHMYLSGGKDYVVDIYAYSGMWDNYGRTLVLELYESFPEIRSLRNDLSVAFEAVSLGDSLGKTYAEQMRILDNTLDIIEFGEDKDRFFSSVAKAKKYFSDNFYGKFSEVKVACVGQTHIDLAWWWVRAQTKEKAVRSFATALDLMRRYPEFRFFSSQVPLYSYVKRYAPELYEEIRLRVKEGRWIVDGGLYLESDCNMTSGESLVRQLAYGKQFFRDEFGVDSRTAWLPDSFGFAASLPQILVKSGIDAFVTSKISWNDTNVMPHDAFMWKGIDGTKIFAYFLTAQDYVPETPPCGYTTYNAEGNLKQVKGTWKRFKDKALSNEVLFPFGHGDGGGGPTEEYLENIRRMSKGIEDCPVTEYKAPSEFIKDFIANIPDGETLKEWFGELYLELHRGTFTSIAKNKRNNRKAEFSIMQAEGLSSFCSMIFGAKYPQEELDEIWKKILFNQFHDILPGSGIKEVYDDSDRDYAEIFQSLDKINGAMKSLVAGKVGGKGEYVAFNPHGFPVSGGVEVSGKYYRVENIPAKGCKRVSLKDTGSKVFVDEKRLENDYFAIEFDNGFMMTSIFDKRAQRQVLRDGGRGNLLEVYDDMLNSEFDAWEIKSYHCKKKYEISEVVSTKILHENGRAGMEICKKFRNSTVTQRIYLYDDDDIIDFKTTADWHEKNLLLKAAFEVDVIASKAVTDIQFGTLERPLHSNTSWEEARFEICAHKFVDLSEDDYGVALMNDCKYGHDFRNGALRITLIKCACSPNPDADVGAHEFSYALYPHSGNHKSAGVMRKSYVYNAPITVVKAEATTQKDLPETYSFVSCESENVICETIKESYDGQGIVLRLFEHFGRRTVARVLLGFDVEKAYVCDIGENVLSEVKISGNILEFRIEPFEIVTIKVIKKNREDK